MFDEIALKYGTDKSSEWHNYGPVYDKIFYNIREQVKTFVEIGIAGGKSLKTWGDFLPNASITGVDIQQHCEIYKDLPKIDIIIGDINKEETIQSLPEEIDVCVDDGSHEYTHQINAFEKIFPRIKPGGLFICEDVSTSYFDGIWRESGPITFSNYCKQLVDEVNFRGIRESIGRNTQKLIEEANSEPHLKIRVDIESITFYNSIIVIEKRK